jgi:GTPase SAR1 family protein
MANVGRPTKYDPSFVGIAYDLALAGYTQAEIAEQLSIHVDTLIEWKKQYADFSEAIRRGNQPATAKVAASLHRMALGYRHKTKKFFYDKDQGKVIEHEYEEDVLPDFRAARFWLEVKERSKWGPQRNESTGTEGLMRELAESLRSSSEDDDDEDAANDPIPSGSVNVVPVDPPEE